MAYNPYMTYMPPTYQQNMNNDRLAYLQQFQQQMPQAQPQQTYNQGLLWVQGEAGAKSYIVAAGASVLLMDSEASKFYIKTTDASGVPSMRTFEYKEILPNQMPQVVAESKEPEYATHEDVEYLKKQIEELKQKLEVKHESTIQPTKRKSTKPDGVWTGEDDERI